ncbi:MAG: ParB N-terminal domain-containing protein [Proteobacteria bacterium]|nr:ParB N-terminal domain-containing protein [Pseudomonadota bacterium]
MTATIPIPLNKLAVWDGNVRKTGASEGLEDLAASIAAHGLLQSLVVKEAPARGKAKGKYQIVAGQRRFMALSQLAKRGAIEADHPVPCQVIVFMFHEHAGEAFAEPVSFRNDYLAICQEVYKYDDAGKRTHLVPRLKRDASR